MRNQSRMARVSLFAGATSFLLASAPAFAFGSHHDIRQKLDPAASSGTCQETATAYAVSTDLQKTSSKQFSDVSGTTVSFTQGSSGCVEVSFSAEAATLPNQVLVTQAVLDNTPCTPSDNDFASDSPSADAADHAMNYICTGVSAGNHTAKIQYKSRYGGKVALDYRTTLVRYGK